MGKKDIDRLTDIMISMVPMLFKMLKQFRHELPQKKDLHFIHNQILFVLKKSGPMNMTALSDKSLVPKPNLTLIIDKLIENGLVERQPDESDRRVISIRLTQAGEDYLKDNISRMKEHFRGMLAGLKDKDLPRVESILDNARYLIDQYQERGQATTERSREAQDVREGGQATMARSREAQDVREREKRE